MLNVYRGHPWPACRHLMSILFYKQMWPATLERTSLNCLLISTFLVMFLRLCKYQLVSFFEQKPECARDVVSILSDVFQCSQYLG